MIIVWHYKDLRLEDNPALFHAANTKMPILPLYIHDEKASSPWQIGPTSLWWLHYSLADLKKRYQAKNSDLIIREGNSEKILKELIKKHPIKEICWNIRHHPSLQKRDKIIIKWLEGVGIKVSLFEGNYLLDPEQTRTSSGTPYLVFTPFANTANKKTSWGKALTTPKITKSSLPQSEPLKSLKLLPNEDLDKKFKSLWSPGRKEAEKKLKQFCSKNLSQYNLKRNFPAEDATSLLSPHLAFGEISPREVWERCKNLSTPKPFLRQILWREFANSFLHHFPSSTDLSWKKEFAKYPWSKSQKNLTLWQEGKTGYPIVDAGMRQLQQEGWMHNRVRMIVGSFLVKDLLIHWKEGAKWFWQMLVDADLANNTLGWQWVAGSGPDAAPYFRIFNPTLQGKKFDPEGSYIRKYVPELAHLPTKWIHTPWDAPSSILNEANITIEKNYPKPIVNHEEARKKALEGYKKIKR